MYNVTSERLEGRDRKCSRILMLHSLVIKNHVSLSQQFIHNNIYFSRQSNPVVTRYCQNLFLNTYYYTYISNIIL